MKGIKVRLSTEAWSDHYSRLYSPTREQVDGKFVTVFPVLHCDDSYNVERGKPTSGQEIYSIRVMKRLVEVVMSEAAVTEMLSDFDFYSSEFSQGEYEEMAVTVRAMRAAAKSIRKQINKETK